MFQSWRKDILNTFKYGITNGTIKGLTTRL